MTRISNAELAAMIDHTILAPSAGQADIRRLCAEARQHGFASVCANPLWASLLVEELTGSEVLPCVVVGFPLGASSTQVKAFEAEQAVSAGVKEVDMVINIAAVRAMDRQTVAADVEAVAQVCHAANAALKVIIETSELNDQEKVFACQVSVAAGADFVKTSTGFSAAGAKEADVKLMRQTVGPNIGVKASGGIRTRQQALAMIAAGANRIGASQGISIIQAQ